MSNKIVSKKEWLEYRRDLLEKEKAHTAVRDELSKARQSLPWVKVTQDYTFSNETDAVFSLADLFSECNQTI